MTVSSFASIAISDIQGQLPRATWTIGTRTDTTSITWHYNGPPVPDVQQSGSGLIERLRIDATWQMRPGWGGTVRGADGLMYHLVIDRVGGVHQTRDLDALLWHCAHRDGNECGIALHVPIGGVQEPSAAQVAALIRVTEALRVMYNITRDRVIGHCEWRHMTACPGMALMRHVEAYRGGPATIGATTPAYRQFRIRSDLSAAALVRAMPTRQSPITGRLKPGTLVAVAEVVEGECIGSCAQWVTLARVRNEQAALGYVFSGLGDWV